MTSKKYLKFIKDSTFSKGQKTVIPAAVVKKLGLTPGDKIAFFESDQGIIIAKIKKEEILRDIYFGENIK